MVDGNSSEKLSPMEARRKRMRKRARVGTPDSLQRHGPGDLLLPPRMHPLIALLAVNLSKSDPANEAGALVIQSPLSLHL